MAKKQLFDVWVVQGNLVYKEVPYAVVADWAQQGRLLPEDQIKPAGSEKWYKLEAVPAFSAFLPRPEPMRADDAAEALEPVTLDFDYTKGD